jgi:hypothetical protein
MDPMTADVPVLRAAHVTLDVLHNGVIWGWFVTMNFWAKSVSTGAVLTGAWLAQRHPERRDFYRLWAPVLGFVFVNITLLFTLLDLHQPLRFWHMFAHPHLTSALNLGAWALMAYSGLLTVQIFAAWRRRDALYDLTRVPTLVLASLATIYTAGLLGQASAREIWSAPTEVAQMILTAGIAGSAALLLLPGHGPSERRALTWVLWLCALVSLTIFAAELVLAPQKSEEAEYVVHTLLSGRLRALFVTGAVLSLAAPSLAVARPGDVRLVRAAAAVSLAGLWMLKHAWLIAPQRIPLS